MPRKKQQDIEATPHRDGMREGVMDDPDGVQIGVNTNTDQAINPGEIAKIRKRNAKDMSDNKEQSNR